MSNGCARRSTKTANRKCSAPCAARATRWANERRTRHFPLAAADSHDARGRRARGRCRHGRMVVCEAAACTESGSACGRCRPSALDADHATAWHSRNAGGGECDLRQRRTRWRRHSGAGAISHRKQTRDLCQCSGTRGWFPRSSAERRRCHHNTGRHSPARTHAARAARQPAASANAGNPRPAFFHHDNAGG